MRGAWRARREGLAWAVLVGGGICVSSADDLPSLGAGADDSAVRQLVARDPLGLKAEEAKLVFVLSESGKGRTVQSGHD